jgi:hypothetical protein
LPGGAGRIIPEFSAGAPYFTGLLFDRSPSVWNGAGLPFFTLKTPWLKVIHDGIMAKRAAKQADGVRPAGKPMIFYGSFRTWNFEFGIAEPA